MMEGEICVSYVKNLNVAMLCVVGISTAQSNCKPGSDFSIFKKDILKDQLVDFFVKNINDEPLRVWEKLQSQNIPNRKEILGYRYPSAELQTLVRWSMSLNEYESRDVEIVFFPSKSELSKLTAMVTDLWFNEMIKRKWITSIKTFKSSIETVDSSVATASDFYSGIDELYKKYDTIRIRAAQNGVDLIIGATAGFKAISAFSLLYAQIHDLPCIYTFESNSSDVIELLPLPLTYALESLDDEMALLRTLVHESEAFGYAREKLPRWLQGLVREKDGKVEPLELATTLVKHYEENRRKTSGIGRGLLDRLEDPLRSYLTERIEKGWAELWLGDQIPETVEHSRRHSKRLMETAANLFRAYGGGEDLLDAPSLALLVSCIYLHDIGHTAPDFPIDPASDAPTFPVGMFPSFVRGMHHLLSRDIITSRAQDLFPEPGDVELKDCVDMLRKLTPLLCAYHRGYTRLAGDRAQPKGDVAQMGRLLYGDGFDETLKPLKQHLQDQAIKNAWEPCWESESDAERALLRVAALLRVIDACDVQADRAVDEIYLEARMVRTWDEAQALQRQLESLAPPKEGGEGDLVYAVMARCVREMQALVGENKKSVVESVRKRKMDRAKLDKCIQSAEFLNQIVCACLEKRHEGGSWKALWRDPRLLQFCSLVNRIAFKLESFPHFAKHGSVGFVLPVPNKQETEKKVTIRLWPIFLLKKENGADNSNSLGEIIKDVENVAKDIEKEIEMVKNQLEPLILTVEVAEKAPKPETSANAPAEQSASDAAAGEESTSDAAPGPEKGGSADGAGNAP